MSLEGIEREPHVCGSCVLKAWCDCRRPEKRLFAFQRGCGCLRMGMKDCDEEGKALCFFVYGRIVHCLNVTRVCNLPISTLSLHSIALPSPGWRKIRGSCWLLRYAYQLSYLESSHWLSMTHLNNPGKSFAWQLRRWSRLLYDCNCLLTYLSQGYLNSTSRTTGSSTVVHGAYCLHVESFETRKYILRLIRGFCYHCCEESQLSPTAYAKHQGR